MNIRRTLCAATAVTRRVFGSFSSSRASRSCLVRALVMQWISVSAEFSVTQAMSGRRASASATADAASGLHCTRSQDSNRPTRRPTGRPTTRTSPSERSLR
ncbi:hypothetical protein [Kitasatospora sp. GP82]|uniref:hypothetical protein n=1 Tax=Kitasatospora sp. GP82 TaxID=3035089 RepID=UPI002473FADE|nr:hypothetical protein [Kitasatospora sp. GP82]MDH6126179.1 hypothetical protein [Kitasatospora sp. GP82]